MLNLFMGPVVAAVAEGTASSLMSTLPLILIMVVLMAVMIIPQRKRDKKVKEMLASIRPGDRVRTIGRYLPDRGEGCGEHHERVRGGVNRFCP